MKIIENDCVGCPPEIGCLGSTCRYSNAPHYYCDECGDEAKLYEYENKELCENCLLEKFPIVEGSE